VQVECSLTYRTTQCVVYTWYIAESYKIKSEKYIDKDAPDGLVGTMPSAEILGTGSARTATLDDAVDKL